MLIAVSSPGSAGAGRAAHEKSPTDASRNGLCHDRRCTDPAARKQSIKAKMVSCHLDDIAAGGATGMELRMHGGYIGPHCNRPRAPQQQ
jgi:hypothetical protein